MFEDLKHDLRYGVRTLLRQPAFMAVALLSLGLGIGLNTTIFSVVNAVLLRDMPIEAPESLVEIYSSPSEEFPHLTSSYPDYLDVVAEADVFDGVIANANVRGILTNDGRSELVGGEVVTDNYFDVLGVSLPMGRSFLPEENETEGTHPVVVLSHGLWQRRMGGDAEAVGGSLRISGVDYTIIGVAPEGFVGTIPGLNPEFWVPLAMVERLSFSGIQSVTESPGETRLERRGTRWLFVKGRLVPGSSVEDARAQVTTLFSRLEAAYPESNEDIGVALLPATSVRFHPMLDGYLNVASLALLIAVGLVLLIACANVANLLLSRAANRNREIAVRLAVGAKRGRLIRQLMTESLLLGLVGGALGVGLAYGAARLLSAYQPSLPIPVSFDFHIDGAVLLYTMALSLFTAVFFGLAPALRATRPSLVPSLKGEESAGSDGAPKRFTLGKLLVVGQLALSLLLLVVGALLTRGLLEAQRVELGFDDTRIASFGFNLQMNNYTVERATTLQRQLLERLEGLPGVDAVSLTSRLPLSPDINMEGIWLPDHHDAEDDAVPIDAAYVGADYFRVTGIAILRGRPFDSRDLEETPQVAIINETMAEEYWSGRDPVGARIFTGGPDGDAVEIIGVSADHKVRSVGEDPRPYIHFARSQFPSRITEIAVGTAGPALTALPMLRQAILEAEPEIVFTSEGTASDVVALTLVPAKMGARLFGAFGALALLLAAVGLYGVIAYSVSRRIREVGLRMALGADGAAVLKLIVGQGMKLVAIGLLVGLAFSVLAAFLLEANLYGVSALDPLAFGVAMIVLVGVALVANVVPALRASRVSPTRALRYE